jgi:alkylresorcinol/alkylpyrone synthase
MGPSTIVATATALPPHVLPQDGVKAAVRALLPADRPRTEAALAMFDGARVERRHSVLSLDDLAKRRRLGQTMELYRESAIALGRKVATDCLRQADVPARAIDLVITVSCTGLLIPSIDAYLASALGFRTDVRRLPITALGCVAGAAALARAHDFLIHRPDAHVLIVAVELPTLSFQHDDVSPAQLVSTAIFGDGAAAVLLRGGGAVPGCAITGVRSHFVPGSEHALGFDLREDGFHVVLAQELPDLLGREVAAAVDRLLAQEGIGRRDLGAVVLHPGGRRILTAVEQALALPRAMTQPSWDVLREHGNQSSAAVLFVLDRWLRLHRPAAGAHGLLAAFGPGLTMELCVLRWI